ncbi:TetR/AcrR family transcriptional regulator [Arthrobacter sp. RCC_34]|uniref:TetR/AcrR family transcriptional regulator n=1 Tax=Arthrobacter sp. RCC_34 TaxID=3239230 RepID=UPI00352605F9
MVSRAPTPRIRKNPAERRDEILDAAARIALAEGLEIVTVRRVAEDLQVRPGLISHYFPSAEEMVSEAFARAAHAELETLLPAEPTTGTPLERLRDFFLRSAGDDYLALSRLWLNARHTSRFRPSLQDAVQQQEAITRDRLMAIIIEGRDQDLFSCPDPLGATLEILVVVDGLGSYANDTSDYWHASLADLSARTAERVLGLSPGTLAG